MNYIEICRLSLRAFLAALNVVLFSAPLSRVTRFLALACNSPDPSEICVQHVQATGQITDSVELPFLCLQVEF